MRIYTKNCQYTRRYVYASIFDQVTRHINIKYIARLTTEYGNSVLKPNNVVYIINTHFHQNIYIMLVFVSLLEYFIIFIYK